MTHTKKIKVLFAKPGLDGHDVGGKIMVRVLKDAGFEVFYSGLRKSPEEIVQMAVDNKVDVIGMSILSGSHIPICKKTKPLLDKSGLQNVLWLMGGNIPKRDHQALKDIGVTEIFSVGSSSQSVIDFINTKLKLEKTAV